MVSSRRLAREWALKVLYQIDVGGASLEEVLEASLERLRGEFVQRGSRTASGSPVEEVCLNALTLFLRNRLPELRPVMQKALPLLAERMLFGEGPYWQELRLEKSFRSQMRGVPLLPPRLLQPLSDSDWMPTAPNSEEELALLLAQMTSEERAAYHQLGLHLRTSVPDLLEKLLRKTALAFAKEVAQNRPVGSPDAVQSYLLARRQAFQRDSSRYWGKVAEMVRKQLEDWLRTTSFITRLVTGATQHHAEINRIITELSSGWGLERQAVVDRNILRLAGFELLYLSDIPTAVTINEAIELAKKFSTEESGRFVNGVLGALAERTGTKSTASVDLIELEDTDLSDLTELEE